MGEQNKMAQGQKPTRKWQLGTVQVAEWKNTSKEGREFSTYSVQRSYKKGNEWEQQTLTGLTREDLVKTAFALNEAYKNSFEKNETEEQKNRTEITPEYEEIEDEDGDSIEVIHWEKPKKRRENG